MGLRIKSEGRTADETLSVLGLDPGTHEGEGAYSPSSLSTSARMTAQAGAVGSINSK